MKQVVQTKHCIPSRDLVLIVKRKDSDRGSFNIARSLARFWDFVLASPRPGAIDSRLDSSQPVRSVPAGGLIDRLRKSRLGEIEKVAYENMLAIECPYLFEAPPAIGSEPTPSNEADIPGEANP